jgi:hypothetical protein
MFCKPCEILAWWAVKAKPHHASTKGGFYLFVIPAQAGIQERRKLLIFNAKMDTRLRGYDEIMNL